MVRYFLPSPSYTQENNYDYNKWVLGNCLKCKSAGSFLSQQEVILFAAKMKINSYSGFNPLNTTTRNNKKASCMIFFTN